ncbi:hypothetical protein PcPA57_15010 [Pasteurella canis]|uniref:hypothetical protein n=1 Tax=Pasteurella canis TaxID=753 RepID=UPI001E53C2E0|nr:hypothetical protein [Pasteurella canis]GJJ80781.1 hypothetical protein PcPA57_15010 [Pasteurella canis]
MKNYKKIILLSTLLTTIPSLSAVNGYKNIDFGSSILEVKNKIKCELLPLSTKEGRYGCPMFLGDMKILAELYFIDDKFAKINLMDIPYDKASVVLQHLKANHTESQEHRILKNDKWEVFFKYFFDEDSVIYLTPINDNKNPATLTYTTKDFDKKYQEFLDRQKKKSDKSILDALK